MQKRKKDKLLDKIVKKDYNDELETVLEKKYFDENVKSILLSILYKLETAYKDYELVKPNVETKDEYIEKVINIIKNDCDDIKIVKLNSKESAMLKNKTFLVEKKSKRIVCYPIERKLLYCIAKINKKEKIIKDKYYVINKTLSDLINVGNNIDMVEPMRDFNGYSWTTIPREIESKYHNIAYQNIRMLVGQKFLNDWITNKEFIIDYLESFNNRIEEKYGKKDQIEMVDALSKISILLVAKYNRKLKSTLEKDKKEVDKKVKKIKNNQEFVKEITKEKKEITKQIKKILNNKKMLQEEYDRRNEFLPLEEKIFSSRILSNIMIKEREQNLKKIEELNVVLNPQKFVKLKEKLEIKEKRLKLLETKDLDEEIIKNLIKLQKIFLKCYKKKIEKEENKQELIKLIYEFRYYCLLPINENNLICNIKELEEQIKEVQILLMKKAHKLKIIDKICEQEEIEYQILKNIFNVRVIKLEDLYIKLVKEKDNKYYIQLFDEDIFED